MHTLVSKVFSKYLSGSKLFIVYLNYKKSKIDVIFKPQAFDIIFSLFLANWNRFDIKKLKIFKANTK